MFCYGIIDTVNLQPVRLPVAVAQNNNDLPIEAQNNNDVPIEAQNNNDLSIEAQNNNDLPIEAQNNNDVPIEVQNNSDLPIVAQNNNDLPIVAQNNNDLPIEAQNNNDLPLRHKIIMICPLWWSHLRHGTMIIYQFPLNPIRKKMKINQILYIKYGDECQGLVVMEGDIVIFTQHF